MGSFLGYELVHSFFIHISVLILAFTRLHVWMLSIITNVYAVWVKRLKHVYVAPSAVEFPVLRLCFPWKKESPSRLFDPVVHCMCAVRSIFDYGWISMNE